MKVLPRFDAAERAVLGRRLGTGVEWPLMVAAAVFLAAYAVPILNPDLPSWLRELCLTLSWVSWALHHRLRLRMFLAD